MHFVNSAVAALGALSALMGVAASPLTEPIARAVQGLKLPANLPDGHYSGDGTVDPATGFARYTYHGPIDWDAVAESASTQTMASVAAPSRLFPRYGPFCTSRSAGDSLRSVIDGFASYWGGKTINARNWFNTYKGTSQAYGCNYNRFAIVANAAGFRADMGSIDSRCGAPNAGYFDHKEDSTNVDYGRDDINAKICRWT